MSLGYNVSDTMRSIRSLLQRYTRNVDWSKVPDVVPAPAKEYTKWNSIQNPEVIISIDKELAKPGATLKSVAKMHGVSTTTVSWIRRRMERFSDMPRDPAGVRKWFERKQRARKNKEWGGR